MGCVRLVFAVLLLPLGEILKAAVQKRLRQFAIKTPIVSKNIGYELRCADPVPFDMEYTRDLGYCAAQPALFTNRDGPSGGWVLVNDPGQYLLAGGNAVMISLQAGHFVPIPFAGMLDPHTGRARIRFVDIHSTRYAMARRQMLRLRRDDFDDPHELAKFAATAGMSLQPFRDEFAP